MKLVDVEEVHEIFNWANQKPPYSKKTIHRYIDMAREVDAVPVIRCKDCKHYTGKWCTKFSTKQFDINDIYKADDAFCSMAERKEE